MKNIFLFLLFLLILNPACLAGDTPAAAKQMKPYGVEDEWRTCSVDEDCTTALRGCWAWEPINKKFLPEFTERNPPACLQSIPPGLQPVTACVNKVCTATDQSTGVTWTEWLRSHQKK